MKVLTVGKLTKNKDDLKAAVEELGGKITGTANKASVCLSTKSKMKTINILDPSLNNYCIFFVIQRVESYI